MSGINAGWIGEQFYDIGYYHNSEFEVETGFEEYIARFYIYLRRDVKKDMMYIDLSCVCIKKNINEKLNKAIKTKTLTKELEKSYGVKKKSKRYFKDFDKMYIEG